MLCKFGFFPHFSFCFVYENEVDFTGKSPTQQYDAPESDSQKQSNMCFENVKQ